MFGRQVRRGVRKARPVKVYTFDWADDSEFQQFFSDSVVCDDLRDLFYGLADNPDAATMARA